MLVQASFLRTSIFTNSTFKWFLLFMYRSSVHFHFTEAEAMFEFKTIQIFLKQQTKSCQNELWNDLALSWWMLLQTANSSRSHETYLFFSILWCWFVEGSNHQAHTGICQDKWIALLFLVSLSLTQLLRP